MQVAMTYGSATVKFHQLHHGSVDVESTSIKQETLSYDADFLAAKLIDT